MFEKITIKIVHTPSLCTLFGFCRSNGTIRKPLYYLYGVVTRPNASHAVRLPVRMYAAVAVTVHWKKRQLFFSDAVRRCVVVLCFPPGMTQKCVYLCVCVCGCVRRMKFMRIWVRKDRALNGWKGGAFTM